MDELIKEMWYIHKIVFQFSSVAQLCLTLCDPLFTFETFQWFSTNYFVEVRSYSSSIPQSAFFTSSIRLESNYESNVLKCFLMAL